jgi:hypothetical protein
MGARLYDARTARFMAPDPIVQVPSWTQSWNRFSYAWNSPHNWVDPTGLENEQVVPDEYGLVVTATPPSSPTSSEPISDIPVAEVAPPLPLPADPGVSPIETPAPLMPPMAGQPGTGPAPDARTPAESPGAGANDEFLPAEWDDSPVPNQAFAPGLENSFSRPEFQVRDSSEMYVVGVAIVTLPVAPELGIGKAAAGLFGRGLLRIGPGVASKITVTRTGFSHVLHRHALGGAAVRSGKSVFSGGPVEIHKLIKAAEGTRAVQQAGGNFQRIVDAGRNIGIDRATGAATSRYTVITNAAGELVTAFPGVP